MGRNKNLKYEWAETLNNVIQHTKPDFGQQKGQWNSKQFLNDNPIVLELGCGRGEYTNGLGKLFPDMNFVGIDVKGDRLAQGGRAAREMELTNTTFLRIHMQVIDEHFAENEVHFGQMFGELVRVLKPGGTCLVVELKSIAVLIF